MTGSAGGHPRWPGTAGWAPHLQPHSRPEEEGERGADANGDGLGDEGQLAPRSPAGMGPWLVLGPGRQAPQTQTHDGVCHESFRGRSGLRSRRVPLASLGMEVAPAPRCLLPAWVEAALVSETGAARLRFPALNISWSRPRTCNRRGLREQASAQTPRASGPCPPAPRPIPARPFHLRLSFFVHVVGGRVGGPRVLGHQLFLYIKSFFT